MSNAEIFKKAREQMQQVPEHLREETFKKAMELVKAKAQFFKEQETNRAKMATVAEKSEPQDQGPTSGDCHRTTAAG